MTLIKREDTVNEIHKYFVEEINKVPYTKDKDGDEIYADMPTVNSLLVCNKELSKRIKSLPSAEAVEVVRCKDCKWSDWYKTLNGEHRCYCMEHGSSGHTEDDYCSYGEREESEVEE